MLLKKEKKTIIINSLKKNLKNRLELTRGDFICIGIKFLENEKLKIQEYQGIIIAKKHTKSNLTILIRCTCKNLFFEYCFLMNTPDILYIKIKYSVNIKRSKLYFLRKKTQQKYKNLNIN